VDLYVNGVYDRTLDCPDLAPDDVCCQDVVVTVDTTTLYEVYGFGTDPAGNLITFPDYPTEYDDVEVLTEPCGGEGCTPGFWKNNGDKHGASAWCDAYDPADSFSSAFGVVITVRAGGKKNNPITDPTLLQALNANGGGINALARHAVAALLNACSDCVQYAMVSPAQVIAAVQAEVPDGDIEGLMNEFAFYNEAGCPVNSHGNCVGVED
jgi:hypothetical protein